MTNKSGKDGMYNNDNAHAEASWSKRLSDPSLQNEILKENFKTHSFKSSIVELCATACSVASTALGVGAILNIKDVLTTRENKHILGAILNMGGSFVLEKAARALDETTRSIAIAQRYSDLLKQLDGLESKAKEISPSI